MVDGFHFDGMKPLISEVYSPISDHARTDFRLVDYLFEGPPSSALEVEADVPSGVPYVVVRTVTENARTLKFGSQGFEKE